MSYCITDMINDELSKKGLSKLYEFKDGKLINMYDIIFNEDFDGFKLKIENSNGEILANIYFIPDFNLLVFNEDDLLRIIKDEVVDEEREFSFREKYE